MDEVLRLERIAKDTHNGQIEQYRLRRTQMHSLKLQEEMLGISVRKRIDQIKSIYPKGTIIAADLGCFVSTIVGDLNKLEGVAAFGIDLSPKLDTTQDLSLNRLMVANLEDMPQIPNNSFHYLMSFNVLSYTDPNKSLPEIYRILKPCGIADLDIEFWEKNFKEKITNLELSRAGHLKVRHGENTLPIKDYLAHKEELNKNPKNRLSLLL